MIGRDTVSALRKEIAPHEPPVLSLYLNVAPTSRGMEARAFILRAREAMRGLDLPRNYEAAVAQRLEKHHRLPQGRTMVLFAGEDLDDLFRVDYMQGELPLLDLEKGDGVEAHWGKPFVAPLMFALDQHERYAVLHVSQGAVRCFEVFLGEIQELWTGEQSHDTGDWRNYTEARHSPGTGKATATRGGTGRDAFEARVDANTERYFRELADHLEATVRSEDIDRIILLGTDETVSTFAGLLNNFLSDRVVARLPNPSNPQAGVTDWLPLVLPTIDEVEAQHELGVLEQVRNRGTSGINSVLTLIRRSQVDVLVVPFHMDATFWQAQGSRIVSDSLEELKTLSPDDEYREVRFSAVLPELVASTNMTVEFVEGEAERILTEELGGLAALRRW